MFVFRLLLIRPSFAHRAYPWEIVMWLILASYAVVCNLFGDTKEAFKEEVQAANGRICCDSGLMDTCIFKDRSSDAHWTRGETPSTCSDSAVSRESPVTSAILWVRRAVTGSALCSTQALWAHERERRCRPSMKGGDRHRPGRSGESVGARNVANEAVSLLTF